MATNIPPHNLNETINGLIALIDNPEISTVELTEHIPGPDFPTGGFIYGKDGIRAAYETGKGVIQLRARAIIERDRKGERESIVVTELPYQTNKAKLIDRRDCVEVYEQPIPEQARYTVTRAVRRGEQIRMSEFPDVSLAAADLLPATPRPPAPFDT